MALAGLKVLLAKGKNLKGRASQGGKISSHGQASCQARKALGLQLGVE